MTKDKKKADLVLSDGREVNFDLTKVTMREWRSMFKDDTPIDKEDEFAAKVGGLTVDEYLDLSLLDNRRFWDAFMKKRREPVDPN